MGSIVDPAVDDGLSLTGPGAPGAAPRGDGEHPVKARLLARARLARGEATEEDVRLLATSGTGGPSPTPPGARLVASVEDLSEPAADAPTESGSARTAADSNFSGASTSPTPGPSSSMTPSPGAVAEELERIIAGTVTSRDGTAGNGPARKSPGDVRSRVPLSPNLVALLATLVGLSALGTVGLFLEPDTFTPAASPAPTAAKIAPDPSAELPPPVVDRPVRKKLPGPWRIADDAGKPGHRVLGGKIGKLAFLKAIEKAGLSKNEAYRAFGSLKEILDLDHCHPKDVFRALVQGSEKRLIAFEYEKSKEEVYQARSDAGGKLIGQKLNLAVERNQIRRAFVYDGESFDDSAVRAGFDEGLAQVAEQAFRGHLGLRELRAGDRLRVIAQEVTVLGEFARYAGIEAIEIVRAGRDPQRFYYFSHPEEGGYFDANGRAPYEGGWRKPIPGAPVTSKFNMKRLHPVLKKVMPHTGTDFGAPAGTPIGATAPGVVSFIGNGGPSGNLVKVKHDGGYESGYAHLSRFEPGLAVGDTVERLETVGYCGSTGRSTGPHLHFTMKKNGEYIDPESLNLDGLRVLGTAHRSAFAEVRQKYDGILEAIALPEVPQALLARSSTARAGTEVDVHAAGNDETSEPEAAAAEGAMAEGALPKSAPPETAEPSPLAATSPAAPAGGPSAPLLAAPTAKALPAGKPATNVGSSAIFLTDADLLQMQGASHEGEVAE